MKYDISSSFASLHLALLYRFDSMTKSVQYSRYIKSVNPLFQEYLYRYPLQQDISFDFSDVVSSYRHFSERKPAMVQLVLALQDLVNRTEEENRKSCPDRLILDTLEEEARTLCEALDVNQITVINPRMILDKIHKENKTLIVFLQHLFSLHFIKFLEFKYKRGNISSNQWQGLHFLVFEILDCSVKYMLFSNINFLEDKRTENRVYLTESLIELHVKHLRYIKNIVPEQDIEELPRIVFLFLKESYSNLSILISEELRQKKRADIIAKEKKLLVDQN